MRAPPIEADEHAFGTELVQELPTHAAGRARGIRISGDSQGAEGRGVSGSLAAPLVSIAVRKGGRDSVVRPLRR